MKQSPQQHYTYSLSTGTIVKTIVIVFLFVMLFYLRDIVFLVLTTIVIASALEPSIRFLTKRRTPRVLAAVLIYLGLVAIIVGVTYTILPSFITDLANFMNKLPTYITTLNVKTHSDLSDNYSGLQSAILGLSKSESLADAVQKITVSLSTASGSALGIITSVFGGVTSFVIVFVLSFYLSVREHGIEQFLRLVLPLNREEYFINLWRRTQHKIGRWIQGQLILALIVGVLVFVALSLLHVQNALFLAFISTLFEIVPVFGPIVGSIPGILAASLQGGLAFGLVVGFVYLVIQQIESNVIYPIVVQKVLDVDPLVVMIALITGARLGGFVGILLAVPVAVAITEYMDDIGKNRTVARALQEKTDLDTLE
jgi:predicted PurR-regulated permease PerM